MSETAAVSLSLAAAPAKPSKPIVVDPNVTHYYSFIGQRWFAGVGTSVKGSLMMFTGGFLLWEIPATPNLVVQMAILGGLLILGGLAYVVRSLADFNGRVVVDGMGIRARLGLTGFNVAWNDITHWRTNENAIRIAELPLVEVWTANDSCPRKVPGGSLTVTDLQSIQQLLAYFAKGKERA